MKPKSGKSPLSPRNDVRNESSESPRGGYASVNEPLNETRAVAKPRRKKRAASEKAGDKRVSRVLKPKPKPDFFTTTIRLPKDLVARIDKAAKANRYSRTEAIYELLKWAIDEHEADEQDGSGGLAKHTSREK
jgi:predicted DNA-binding protein